MVITRSLLFIEHQKLVLVVPWKVVRHSWLDQLFLYNLSVMCAIHDNSIVEQVCLGLLCTRWPLKLYINTKTEHTESFQNTSVSFGSLSGWGIPDHLSLQPEVPRSSQCCGNRTKEMRVETKKIKLSQPTLTNLCISKQIVKVSPASNDES